LLVRTRPIVRPRADSRGRTNRSSANPVGLGMQACQTAGISLNSPLGPELERVDYVTKYSHK
jgi:hypothetical protein